MKVCLTSQYPVEEMNFHATILLMAASAGIRFIMEMWTASEMDMMKTNLFWGVLLPACFPEVILMRREVGMGCLRFAMCEKTCAFILQVCGNVIWVIQKFLFRNSAKAIITRTRQMLHSVSVGEASGDVLMMANVSKILKFAIEAVKVATVYNVLMRRNIFATIFGSVLQVLQKITSKIWTSW